MCPFTKEYNLVPVNERWRSAAGKVTEGLASHVTDFSGVTMYWLTTYEREMSTCLRSTRIMAPLTSYLLRSASEQLYRTSSQPSHWHRLININSLFYESTIDQTCPRLPSGANQRADQGLICPIYPANFQQPKLSWITPSEQLANKQDLRLLQSSNLFRSLMDFSHHLLVHKACENIKRYTGAQQNQKGTLSTYNKAIVDSRLRPRCRNAAIWRIRRNMPSLFVL